MSYSHNQKIIFWERTEDTLRSTEVTMDSRRLSNDDVARVANAYVLWALCTQDLLGNTRYTSDKALKSWVENLAKFDLSVVMSVCKQTLACVRNWQSHVVIPGRDSFKHYLSEMGVQPGSEILRPFWSAIYKYSETFAGFGIINTLLQFITRLTLTDVDWITDENLQEYVLFEDKLAHQSYPPDILTELNLIARERFLNYKEIGRPGHGNGATSATQRGAGKATKFTKFVNTWGTYQLQLKYDTQHPLIGDVIVSGNELDTRVIPVPKGIDKKRIVSPEPICNMYYQHMFAENIDYMFRQDPAWCVDLHDQTHNQVLAMRGSETMDYATIDLSAASDSVTLTLVKGIFDGIPALNDWLRCRTRYGILPSGTRIHLEKFSPMGSSLCFPIECMVFSLIVQLANRRNHVNRYFRVYGDDIVVHRDIFNTVIQLLEELHFTVNNDKTFGPYSQFTESCGIECYNGVDVTPFRLPRAYDITKVRKGTASPDRVIGAIDLCNRMHEYGLYTCRSYLLHEMLEVIPSLPFSDSYEFGIYSANPDNYRAKYRYNRDLQRIEHKVCVPVVKEKKVPDDIRYQLLLEQYALTTRSQLHDPSDRIDLMVGDSRIHLRERWMWLG